jgi:hypothetical protein
VNETPKNLLMVLLLFLFPGGPPGGLVYVSI